MPEFTQEEKYVLWHVGSDNENAEEPSGFQKSLIGALFLADRHNFLKLTIPFPEFAEAVKGWKYGELQARSGDTGLTNG